MNEVVENLGQEWCNPVNIDLKGSGYITTGTPDGLLVLCRKEKFESVHTSSGLRHIGGIRYIPLKFEDLNKASSL